MAIFVTIGRHSPESCAAHNETSRKIMIEWMAKGEELAAKHGVKIVGGWNIHPEHLTIQVLEAPSIEAMEALTMEPENMAMLSWNTLDIKLATTLEDVMKYLVIVQGQ
jgi:hypothetical protein